MGFFQNVPAAPVVVKCPIFFLHTITHKPGFPARSRIPQYITLWEPSDCKRLRASALQAVITATVHLEQHSLLRVALPAVAVLGPPAPSGI